MYGPEQYLIKSKKPHIQALVAAAANMTTEDIEKLDEKTDIIRGLLAIKKKSVQAESAARAEQLADMMIKKYHPDLF